MDFDAVDVTNLNRQIYDSSFRPDPRQNIAGYTLLINPYQNMSLFVLNYNVGKCKEAVSKIIHCLESFCNKN